MRRIVLALLLAVSATPLLATEPITFGPYQYDGAGNIFAIGTSESFAYDRDSRLVTAVMTPGTQKFGYDPFGNRTSAHIISGITHCNGGADCVRTPDPPVQPRTNRFADATYNAAGAIVTLDGRNYTYDVTGMMTSQHNTQLVQYVYTADDERIAVYSNSRWEWSLRDPGAHVIRQVTSDDATSAPVSTSWTWVDDQVFRAGAMLASERLTTGRRHFHLDHLGTPRLITADTGAIAAQYEYYPFGPQPDDGLSKETPTEKLKFTGHERDLATGDAEVLDYMHARYYEGTAGRFLAVDPALHADRAVHLPQKWNRYAYALNNPVLNIDPDGKDEVIAAHSNVAAIKSYLTELVRRPGGRTQFMQVVNDHNFIHRMTTGPLTAPAQINLAVEQRRTITAKFGETTPDGHVQQPSPGAPGQFVVTGALTTFDPNAISRLHPDTTGATTASHEYDHVNALQTGGVEAAKAGDVPTSATGPSERKGRTIAAEQPDMTPQDARRLVDQYVKVDR